MFEPKRCIQPWMQLEIHYDGTFGTCEFLPFARPNDDLMALWNSAPAKKMRRNIIDYDTRDSVCHRCGRYRIQTLTPYGLSPRSELEFMSEKQRENEERIRQSLISKEEVVSHYPFRLYLHFGLKCNLNCIMCAQQQARKEHKEILEPGFLYNQMDVLTHASEILLVGGEVFLIPQALEFLRFASENEELRKHTRFSFITNGTCVDEHLELLEKFDRLQLFFSIDSSGEHYEKIRRGAKWNSVKENVELINAMTTARPGWSRPMVLCALMKSGLPGLRGLCEWLTDKSIPHQFFRIFSCEEDENFFDNPELLASIPNWRAIFCDCISLLCRKNSEKTAKHLIWYYAEIHHGSRLAVENEKNNAWEMRKILVRALCGLIPFKKSRKKLRRKLLDRI